MIVNYLAVHGIANKGDKNYSEVMSLAHAQNLQSFLKYICMR